jgi:hypothetical protein
VIYPKRAVIPSGIKVRSVELLSKIIDGATESTEALSNLLRRCLVLADELKNDNLANWVQKELNGYDGDDELPGYRIVRIVAKGFFVGPYGSQISDQPLPPLVLDPEHRDWAQLARLTQPIASYESIRGGSNNPRIEWPPSLTAFYQTKFFDHYVLNRAWQEIPSLAFVALTDTVRNRILSLALELKRQLRSVNDESERLAPEKVDKSVVYHIYGNNNVIASTAQTINQAGRDVVTPGDAESLIKALLQFGVEKVGAHEIVKSLGPRGDEHAPSLGQRTASVIKEVASKVAAAGGKMTTAAATSVITQMVLQYLGLRS